MKIILSFLLLLSSISSIAQTYIGELTTTHGHEYMKLEVKNDSTYISFPYEFRQKFGFDKKAEKGNSVTVSARSNHRELVFDEVSNDHIKLSTEFTGFHQEIKLWKQLSPIEPQKLSNYSGNFKDENGNRIITYVRNGYLHLMSPYTEQTVSLKPIGKHQFWSVSGETTVFSNEEKGGFQTLIVKNRNGEAVTLQRSHSFKVVEDWVMIDQDSIFVNIFIPNTKGKKSACLLLPGGGGQSQIENFQYEARLFASHGMVAMTFDKESVGRSKGQSFENYTFQEKALRYQQLFQFLQSHEEVDSKKVGLHGPSEGGRLALMMGINLGHEVAFINATAAPIMTSLEGQLYATNHYSRNLGMSEEEIATSLMIWKNYYQGIIAGKIDTIHFETIRFLQSKYRRAFLPPASDVIPLSPNKQDLLDDSVVKNAHLLMSPVFLQYGENDQRVNPMRSLQNFYGNISQELNATAELYERGNHSMMTPEYEICSGYSYDKINWLKSINMLP